MSAARVFASSAVPDIVRAAAIGPDGARLADFAGRFFARVQAEDLATQPVEAWLAVAREALAFAGSREPGKPKIALSNPTTTAHTVLRIANDDMPFLVDSVSMAMAERGIGTHLLIHPVMPVERVGDALAAVGSGKAESLMHIEIDRQAGDELPAL